MPAGAYMCVLYSKDKGTRQDNQEKEKLRKKYKDRTGEETQNTGEMRFSALVSGPHRLSGPHSLSGPHRLSGPHSLSGLHRLSGPHRLLYSGHNVNPESRVNHPPPSSAEVKKK